MLLAKAPEAASDNELELWVFLDSNFFECGIGFELSVCMYEHQEGASKMPQIKIQHDFNLALIKHGLHKSKKWLCNFNHSFSIACVC